MSTRRIPDDQPAVMPPPIPSSGARPQRAPRQTKPAVSNALLAGIARARIQPPLEAPFSQHAEAARRAEAASGTFADGHARKRASARGRARGLRHQRRNQGYPAGSGRDALRTRAFARHEIVARHRPCGRHRALDECRERSRRRRARAAMPSVSNCRTRGAKRCFCARFWKPTLSSRRRAGFRSASENRSAAIRSSPISRACRICSSRAPRARANPSASIRWCCRCSIVIRPTIAAC